MSNRHERRKNAKLGHVVEMSTSDLLDMPSGCAWNGCGAMTHNPDKDGWSKMVLYNGKTETDFMAISARDMLRDCVLCPTHARQLDEQVLINIGGRLRYAEGSA